MYNVKLIFTNSFVCFNYFFIIYQIGWEGFLRENITKSWSEIIAGDISDKGLLKRCAHESALLCRILYNWSMQFLFVLLY